MVSGNEVWVLALVDREECVSRGGVIEETFKGDREDDAIEIGHFQRDFSWRREDVTQSVEYGACG